MEALFGKPAQQSGQSQQEQHSATQPSVVSLSTGARANKLAKSE